MGTRSKVDQLAQRVVFEVSKKLVSSFEYEEALEDVLKTMCQVLEWQTGAFFRFAKDQQYLSCEAFYSSVPCTEFEAVSRTIKFSKGFGLPGRVWEKMTNVWIQDVVVDLNFPRFAQADAGGLHSAFGFPVRFGDEFIGVFEFFHTKISKPTKTMLDAFTIVGTELGMFLQHREIDRRLDHQSKRLSAVEAKFKIFADHSDECLFISAPLLTKHYFVSNAFADIFEYPVEEVYADANIWAHRIAPEDKARVLDYVSRLKGYSMPEPSIEYQIIRTDGSRAWLGVKIFAALDQQDGTYHICGAVEDITERKAMDKRISEFYSLISHEMKTPLTSIKCVFQLLEDECGQLLNKETTQLLSLGTKECGRLLRLVNDLLDLKRIEVGKLNFAFEEFDARQIAERTVENLRFCAKEANVTLQVQISSSQMIRGDRDRLMQVMTNLLSNAIKFSPPDSVVLVVVEAFGGSIKFTVTDCGPGIKFEDQALLFNLFQQLASQPNAKQDGTGLGLAISKAIVDEHGGSIGVRSTEGEGSTFWFELPLIEVLAHS